MGMKRGVVRRADVLGSATPEMIWCEAAECLRGVVDALVFPGHVAGYLRGHADSMEFHCARGAPVDVQVGDVVNARAGHLAAYAREPTVSWQLGIPDQHRRIEIAAKRGLFAVASWHEDESEHAKNRRTPGLQDARAQIKQGKVGGIVVAELARLGRNSLDVLDLIERSHTEGWRLVALDCNLDATTPCGDLVLDALRFARRMEWRKVPQPRRRPAARDRHLASPNRPRPVPPAVVDQMVAMRGDGRSYRAIAASLNERLVAPPTDEEWGASSVRRVLRTVRGDARAHEPSG
jgi:DNA invertase Pin-like site-specific DNA recombinase